MRKWLCIVYFWMIASLDILADVRVTGDRGELACGTFVGSGCVGSGDAG